jgi:hypothetical protein
MSSASVMETTSALSDHTTVITNFSSATCVGKVPQFTATGLISLTRSPLSRSF